MPSYQAKQELQSRRQLKVQKMSIPFLITANATPASKVVTRDEPGILFLNVEGISGITVAAGAMDTSAELSAITFATATDSTGVFNACVRVGEQIAKVCSARITSRAGASDVVAATFPTGATTGITSVGDKIVLNLDCGRDFSAANGDYCLEVEYVLAE